MIQYKKFIIVSILAGIILISNGKQLISQRPIDSLKMVVLETENDSIRARNYIKLSYLYYRINQDSSLDYAQKAYDLAKQIENRELIGSALNDLGRGYVYKSQYNVALYYFNLALEHNEKYH